ncbi:hypothetical protein Tco_0226616 [Tanacetum coccineum]
MYSLKKNMNTHEAASTKLAALSYLPTFWAEAVSTACYVQNRVLIVQAYNRPPLTSLEKSDEGFFCWEYSLSSKAFRVITRSFLTTSTSSQQDQDNARLHYLEKPLVQDKDAADVDEHLYRSMIGSLIEPYNI